MFYANVLFQKNYVNILCNTLKKIWHKMKCFLHIIFILIKLKISYLLTIQSILSVDGWRFFTSNLHRCYRLTQSSLAHMLVAVWLWDVSSDWMPGWVSGIGDHVVHTVFVGTGMVPRSHTQTCSAHVHSGRGGQGPSLSQNPFGNGMLFNIWKRFICFERVFWLKRWSDLVTGSWFLWGISLVFWSFCV